MPPQISIVLPVRNASKFIGECIESILLQTFTNFEVVVVNDGSTDESIEIINSFRSYKIRILQNKGKGISDALNWGIKHTIGALICRMDADDICYPSRLELQYDKFRTDDKIDIVCTRVKYGSTIEESVPLDSITQHEDIKYFLLFQNPIVHSSVMFRKKSLLSKSLLYDSNYNGSEDYELWCRCMIYGLKFLILDSYELFYRVHSGQSSLEGNQLLKNLLIKANYGNSVLSPSFDCTSISYLQLMTRDAIFVTERHGEDIRKIYNQLNSSIPNKSLKAYLEHNLERIFKEIRA